MKGNLVAILDQLKLLKNMYMLTLYVIDYKYVIKLL
jgi:hypothetical protein